MNNPLGNKRDFVKETGAASGIQDAIRGAGRDFIDYDPVGLPDAADVKNIRNIIKNFEKGAPGVIAAFAKQARADRELDERAWIFGGKKGDEPRRPVLTMPTPLLRDIEESYPLMFQNKKHLAWFKLNFNLFNVR